MLAARRLARVCLAVILLAGCTTPSPAGDDGVPANSATDGSPPLASAPIELPSPIATPQLPVHAVPAPKTGPLPDIVPNSIEQENLQPGEFFELKSRASPLQGYVQPFSTVQGGTVSLFVNATRNYTASIERIGWYGGAGARVVATIGEFPPQAQPAPVLNQTWALETFSWDMSASISVGVNWTSGIYVVKLASNGIDPAYVPFVVKSATAHGSLLFHTNEFTWQAYNQFGGSGLYGASTDVTNATGLRRAVAVDLARPFPVDGTGQLNNWEIPMVRFLEKRGLNIDYAADIDIATGAVDLSQYRGVITAGHDEYWTPAMRDQFDAARDSGTNLAFFAGNSGYWVSRLVQSPGGIKDILVCYKTPNDPIRAIDPAQTTNAFALAPVNRSEALLFGMHWSAGNRTDLKPLFDEVIGDAARSTFKNAPTAGTVIPGIVGYEWESVVTPVPTGLVVLGTSHPSGIGNLTLAQSATIYRAPSGAFVFSAGTISWVTGLERWPVPAGKSTPSPDLVQLTEQIVQLAGGNTSVLQPSAPLLVGPSFSGEGVPTSLPNA